MPPNLIVAFITGLTAGGIGCLVVQSGLLAASLARHFEQDHPPAANRVEANMGTTPLPRFVLTISLFLLAKLAAYTFLGFLLGAFGSVLQLTFPARVVLMIAIGIFILGNGLRMLGAHPVFRWFVLEPPSAVTRFIRRASKNDLSPLTPLFLGALTVLLPCGISQAMMATALGTGDPLQGAALLFAFTLGTIPIFFSAAYFATRMGAVIEGHFTRIVALLLIVLGAISILHGLNLAGAPISLPRIIDRLTAAPYSHTLLSARGIVPGSEAARTISVSDAGYTPSVLHLPAGQPVTLIWTIHDSACCARAVVVPALDYETLLPPTGQVPLMIPAQKPGTVISYSCATGRNTGRLVFDLKTTGTNAEQVE
ncbi:MAG: sulfite exporter TauE/SafE family protein [Syntrophobacter sp.]